MVHTNFLLHRTAMKHFLLHILFTIVLFAANPTIFASLGDNIYNNAPKIEKLTAFKEYEPFIQKIREYIKEVNATKKLGFAIENGTHKNASGIYLKKLRELAKTNDFFVRSANAIFDQALKNSDFDTVMNILDTGLIDVQRNRQKLLKFYEIHNGEFEPRGLLKKLVDASDLQKKSKHSKEYYEHLRKMREQEKIRRLREKDKKRQEELQKRLEEELKRKKEQIQKEQIRELKQEGL